MSRRPAALLVLLAAAAAAAVPRARAFGTSYKPMQQVPVLVNTVGPFHNPAEEYRYYSLPFCVPADLKNRGENLGGTIAGDRRASSLYDVRFGVDNDWVSLCRVPLNQNQIKWFTDAIKRQFMFEMFVDELPCKGFVGEVERFSETHDSHVHNSTFVYLFTHLDFSVSYNGNRVIAVDLTTDPSQRKLLEFGDDMEVEFSYSVRWKKTNVTYVNRMSLHSQLGLGAQSMEIHWLSIFNSIVLVLMLTTLLTLIFVRALRKDIARFVHEDDDGEAGEQAEDSGWKLVHGDVFRPPPYPMLFSSCYGTGAQLLAMVGCLLLLAVMGTFYPGKRGALYSAAIFLYALTAGIAGYVGTTLYLQLGGTRWATNAVLTGCLYAVPCLFTFACNNTVAVTYGSTAALPFATILVIVTMWALVTFPLTVLGAMKARREAAPFDAPCKTNRVAREIPAAPFYRSAPFQVVTAGLLPFSAIYIELHYVFRSIFGQGAYTLFGVLCLAFVLLLIVTAFVTVALTYFQLAAEDHRWWWRSFLSAGSTGFFMYAYAIFYYHYCSSMSGTLQASFFFGYLLMVAYGFFLMLGAVGWHATLRTVRYLYLSIKVD